jgi:hypothetical protein
LTIIGVVAICIDATSIWALIGLSLFACLGLSYPFDHNIWCIKICWSSKEWPIREVEGDFLLKESKSTRVKFGNSRVVAKALNGNIQWLETLGNRGLAASRTWAGILLWHGSIYST